MMRELFFIIVSFVVFIIVHRFVIFGFIIGFIIGAATGAAATFIIEKPFEHREKGEEIRARMVRNRTEVVQ